MGQRVCTAKHAKIPELHLRLVGRTWMAGLHCFIRIPGWFAHPHNGFHAKSFVPAHRLVSLLLHLKISPLLTEMLRDRQYTLMTMAVGVFAIAFNSFGAKHLPLFEGVMLAAFVVGFFAICIPLWVLVPKAPASEVFGKFDNFGGWASIGAACIVGQSAASAAFIVSSNLNVLTTACTDCINRASIARPTWPKKSRTHL
jgi:hypothetical protein